MDGFWTLDGRCSINWTPVSVTDQEVTHTVTNSPCTARSLLRLLRHTFFKPVQTGNPRRTASNSDVLGRPVVKTTHHRSPAIHRSRPWRPRSVTSICKINVRLLLRLVPGGFIAIYCNFLLLQLLALRLVKLRAIRPREFVHQNHADAHIGLRCFLRRRI